MTWQVWTIALAYLLFGFTFGIFREWSYQWIWKYSYPEPNPAPKDLRERIEQFSTLFNFPLIETGIVDEMDSESDYPKLLTSTNGGFLYQSIMAFLWPIPVLWSMFWLAILGVLEGFCLFFRFVATMLSSLGHKYRRCTQRVRNVVGIR